MSFQKVKCIHEGLLGNNFVLKFVGIHDRDVLGIHYACFSGDPSRGLGVSMTRG